MGLCIREMTIDDYESVRGLWESADGIDLAVGDAREEIVRFLQRNPAVSFVAEAAGDIVGAVLCGHDGRRGYVHHLAVEKDFRRRGIGRALAERCLAALRAAGIGKCHLFIRRDNSIGLTFWQRTGWIERAELRMMSRMIAADDQDPGGR